MKWKGIVKILITFAIDFLYIRKSQIFTVGQHWVLEGVVTKLIEYSRAENVCAIYFAVLAVADR